MKVKQLMQSKVFTVGQDDPIDRVFFLIHYEKIRHLPVMSKRKVVGIVSDRDLYKALGPRTRGGAVSGRGDATPLFVRPRKVRHIMRRGVLTISPDADVAQAAAVMGQRKIGALPVIKNQKLVGIITATDLLKAFVKLSADVDRLVKSV